MATFPFNAARNLCSEMAARSRATAAKQPNEPADELAAMNERDENGWAPIHQAAFHGYVKSIEKFVTVGKISFRSVLH